MYHEHGDTPADHGFGRRRGMPEPNSCFMFPAQWEIQAELPAAVIFPTSEVR